MAVFKRQNKPLKYLQNKTSQNFKMSLTRIYWYVCCEMNVFFFEVFVNHFPKIRWKILHRITADLLYFWLIYDVNLWE